MIPTTAICVWPDGNAWCAAFGDFVNLQESPAAFGATFDEALANLTKLVLPKMTAAEIAEEAALRG